MTISDFLRSNPDPVEQMFQSSAAKVPIIDDESCVYPETKKMTIDQFEYTKQDHLKLPLNEKFADVKHVDIRQGEPSFFTVVLRNDAPFETKGRLFTLK